MVMFAYVCQYCQLLLFYVASDNFSLPFLLLFPSLCKNLMHAWVGTKLAVAVNGLPMSQTPPCPQP